MEKIKKMTPAEFRAIRLMWGLSQQWIAEQMQVSQPAVVKWEREESKIPNEAKALLIYTLANLESRITSTLELVSELDDKAEVILVCYKTQEDLYQYHPDFAPLPLESHTILQARIMSELEMSEYPCRIVFFDKVNYKAWLKGTHKKHTKTSIAEWAGIAFN